MPTTTEKLNIKAEEIFKNLYYSGKSMHDIEDIAKKMKYKTLEEAKRAASFENMGRDYSTAIVRKVEDYYIIEII